MQSHPLPPELAELERRLLARHLAWPPETLRNRVLIQARRERMRPLPIGTWQFAAAILVAALLGGNLILAATRATAQHLGMPAAEAEQLLATADRIQAVVPEISRREAFRQAWLLDVQQRLGPVFPRSIAPLQAGVSGLSAYGSDF